MGKLSEEKFGRGRMSSREVATQPRLPPPLRGALWPAIFFGFNRKKFGRGRMPSRRICYANSSCQAGDLVRFFRNEKTSDEIRILHAIHSSGSLSSDFIGRGRIRTHGPRRGLLFSRQVQSAALPLFQNEDDILYDVKCLTQGNCSRNRTSFSVKRRMSLMSLRSMVSLSMPIPHA